ncbi:MAG: ParB N-terminal domain-containing protein [Rhodospirillales bacterium]|nr:ParB N-terminal domain-containing protein [Rhodospirillales bacterium]
MAELRSVDPRTLHVSRNNPRRTPVPPAMDEQLVASIRAVGIIQPPCVIAKDGGLEIAVGNRRVKAAITAGLEAIDVLVCTAGEAADAMRAVAENLIRASMSSIDIWRAIERLEAQSWNEQAIGDALALPVRTVRRLKLLAELHPPMLDVMALGSMPNEEQLRTIAAAAREEQAQVWKRHKPKKGQAEVAWYEVARALAKRRMPASAAKFGDDLAKAYGIVWEDDLFAPPGEDSRTTTNVEGFFAAQQEWLQNNLPERGTLLPVNDYGQGQLPKKAERVYSKPGKTDLVGHYIDVRTGAVETVAYRLPEPKKAGKPADGTRSTPGDTAGAPADGDDTPSVRARPDVTQKGVAMIGDLRTEALHQALADMPIEDDTLLGLLVLAFGGDNVTVDSGSGLSGDDRRAVCGGIVEGGVLTADLDLLRQAARRMLIGVLSCRENRSQSGAFARIAGEAIGASQRLPNMATEEFLSCLSRGALETAARTEGVRVEPRAKDTRDRMITRFKDGTFIYPGALFRLTPEELAAAAERRHGRSAAGWVGPATGEGGGDDDAEPEVGDEDGAGFEREAA